MVTGMGQISKSSQEQWWMVESIPRHSMPIRADTVVRRPEEIRPEVQGFETSLVDFYSKSKDEPEEIRPEVQGFETPLPLRNTDC